MVRKARLALDPSIAVALCRRKRAARSLKNNNYIKDLDEFW